MAPNCTDKVVVNFVWTHCLSEIVYTSTNKTEYWKKKQFIIQEYVCDRWLLGFFRRWVTITDLQRWTKPWGTRCKSTFTAHHQSLVSHREISRGYVTAQIMTNVPQQNETQYNATLFCSYRYYRDLLSWQIFLNLDKRVVQKLVDPPPSAGVLLKTRCHMSVT